MAELTIAIAKGRLQDAAISLFRSAGIVLAQEAIESRRLRVDDESGRFSFIFVKPSDVPVYVEYGVADAGICGRDVLMESNADVHEPLDLGFGRCQMVVAGKPESAKLGYNPLATARIATKYPRLTADYFQRRGVPVEMIVLSGSVELAPALGLSEHIVDLVETGRTLQENGLVVIDTVLESTARLIVNRAGYHLKRTQVASLIGSLRHALTFHV
ncbi:MAG TPA: ATP phosphoribosyltransferase [Blastocatellia bacterium]|jgi:ATP phosphoribosyltransferase|nr:ATP phosphoribosyltransferase [Blastocatellia bacterium]